MNSYQRRIKERDQALDEVQVLKRELHAKGNIFFKEHKWLGFGRMRIGAVIDGKLTTTDIVNTT